MQPLAIGIADCGGTPGQARIAKAAAKARRPLEADPPAGAGRLGDERTVEIGVRYVARRVENELHPQPIGFRRPGREAVGDELPAAPERALSLQRPEEA